jgi:dolichol kinase/membrane-associated phospholipid phosphatase
MHSEFEITDNFKNKFAYFISTIAHAPILSIPAFIAINYFLLDWYNFIIITIVSIIFAAILPITIVLIWGKKKNRDVDIPRKEDRNYPLIVVIISYFIGAVILYMLNAPFITTFLMFCYFSNTLIVLFINIFWKISIHSMGVAGPTTALIYTFGYIGSILGLILPIVMWSRVYLKRHNISQVIMGASLGFALTAIQIYILSLYTYNIKLNIYPILWLIYAFMAPSVVLSMTGLLNKLGMHDGYTRKIFHFIAFISIAVFLRYAPSGAAIIFIIVGVIYVGIACFSGNGFLWFDGIRRKSDHPNELLYVILPMVSTILGLSLSWKVFGHPFVEMGMLCVAIGDAVAEPIGVRFGKHRYTVYSLTGRPSERSSEGSVAVLLSCAAIIFFATNNLTLSLFIGVILSLIEAVSPRGTDNFTVLVGASMLLSFGLYIISNHQ